MMTEVLPEPIALLQAVGEPEDKFVIVTVVAPVFAKVVVENVPVPAVLTIIVAVKPVAAFGALRLYVTVYVPTGNPAAEEVSVTVEAFP